MLCLRSMGGGWVPRGGGLLVGADDAPQHNPKLGGQRVTLVTNEPEGGRQQAEEGALLQRPLTWYWRVVYTGEPVSHAEA